MCWYLILILKNVTFDKNWHFWQNLHFPAVLGRYYDVVKVIKNYLWTVLCQLCFPIPGKHSNNQMYFIFKLLRRPFNVVKMQLKRKQKRRKQYKIVYLLVPYVYRENGGTIVLRSVCPSVPPSVCQFPSHKMCGTQFWKKY